MPANLNVDYFIAEKEYREAKSTDQKIKALKKMLAMMPHHKGTENLEKELKERIKKLISKKQKESAHSKSRKTATIAKQGDAQVCIVGLTQSGKSTLLSILTNAKPKISNIPFTTNKPQIGSIIWRGIEIQIIEIPSNFSSANMNIAQNSDAIIATYEDQAQLQEIEKIINNFKLSQPIIRIRKDNISIEKEKIIQEIWSKLNLIKIYTKEPGKPKSQKALVLRQGSTIKNCAGKLHKDFIKFFKFARIWGKSAKFDGQSVGLDHKLEDEDIVEIHIT